MIQTSLHLAFSRLRDPRIERAKKHNLLNIIILSSLAVLSGAESYDSIELFGKTNSDFLKQFLGLNPHMIPSIVCLIHASLNASSYLGQRWRGSWKGNGGSKDGFHHRFRYMPGALKTEFVWDRLHVGKRPMKLLLFHNCLNCLTLKAVSLPLTQRAIAEKIIDNGGDSVKGNQGGLEEEI